MTDEATDGEPRGGLMTFRQIAQRIGEIEQRRISKQAIVQDHQRALRKLREAIERDRELLDVLAERNLR